MSLGLLWLTNCEHSPRREPVRVRGVELDLVTSATWQTFHCASQCVCNGLNTRCSSWILTHILIPGKFEKHVQLAFILGFVSKCRGTFLPLVASHFCQSVTVVWNWKYPNPMGMSGPPLATHSQVKVQPHSVDFYSAVRDSKRDVKELLTESLSRFSTLTEAWPGSPVNGAVRWGRLKVV